MKVQLKFASLMLTGMLVATPAFADQAAEEAQVEQEVVALEETAKEPTFGKSVQEKYKLTDEQMKQMEDAGIKGPHLAMTAQLAASSGKTIEEVAKMRTEQKMGWGKIAKELGIHPGTLGNSIAELRKENRDARKEAKREEKAERKQERAEKKAEKKQERADRKQQRQDKKNKAS